MFASCWLYVVCSLNSTSTWIWAFISWFGLLNSQNIPEVHKVLVLQQTLVLLMLYLPICHGTGMTKQAAWLYGTSAEHEITHSFFKKWTLSIILYDSSVNMVNCLHKLSFADIWTSTVVCSFNTAEKLCIDSVRNCGDSLTGTVSLQKNKFYKVC